MRLTALGLMALGLCGIAHAEAPLREMADPPQIHYLNPAEVAPRLIFAPPPGEGMTRQELDFLHRLIAVTPADRIVRARADGEDETPAIYSVALGRDLGQMPATWNLLVTIEEETNAVVAAGKDEFARPRPYQSDPTMPTCKTVKQGKSQRSYPSGHAGVGYSMGWALARLAPQRAEAVLARADDYAMGRWFCGVHYPSDTSASRGAAMVVAERLLADPRLAVQVAAARTELAGLR
ncbi:phosphatase PAP2 family protein [Novosphingobium sp. KACC 22771]|uniref:phosphatase PAP2 family protein n=1 Tax=Novosphingobium sp. KACC 22771 TaxID=3025670 RepID=UPI0023654BDD|nr:phosphatase PAP2 family protein [Novosphingobium sp. KACC 22771]WDF71027.1 phosphatase PAP2 family protein [Novosphingobium sp. KACC 22771]